MFTAAANAGETYSSLDCRSITLDKNLGFENYGF